MPELFRLLNPVNEKAAPRRRRRGRARAQAVGAVCTTLAAVFALALDWTTAADALLALMVVFATLESAFAICVGCAIFAGLMRLGIVPAGTCEACSNFWTRTPGGAAGCADA